MGSSLALAQGLQSTIHYFEAISKGIQRGRNTGNQLNTVVHSVLIYRSALIIL